MREGQRIFLNKTRFSPLKRGVIVNIILWVLLLTTFLLGCNTGRFAMSVREVFVTLFGGGTREMNLALFTYRLPRVCLAILVGLGMGVSGVVMQDLLHNNLASPGTLGVSAGSGLFVTLYVALLRTQSNNAVLMPVLALGGGLLSAGLIFLLGTKRKQALQPTRLIMTGVALSSAYSAVSTFLMLILDENQMEFLQRWQSGELWGTDWKYVTVLAIWISVFGLLTFRGGMTLNVINIGYDVARGLGVNVGRQFVFLSFCAVALSSSAVAFGGNFFFLGLIGPHIARKLVGTDARVLMPAAGAAAGIIVLLADILVKSLDFLAGIPTGIVVSVISVPYFLYLLVRK